MNDTPVLNTPGEMISEARTARELTIAQLSERTKIPPPVLIALEMDEYHKISGPLYIKSFLRTCAVDLGLDPETVLSLYNKISGEMEAGSPGAETVWGEEQVQVSRIGLPWLRITVGVGVVAVMVGLVLFAMRGCGDENGPADDLAGAEIQRLSPEESVAAGVARDTAGPQLRSESLIAAETEAELQEKTAAREPDLSAPSSTLPDSFTHDWIVGSAPPLPEDPVAEEQDNLDPVTTESGLDNSPASSIPPANPSVQDVNEDDETDDPVVEEKIEIPSTDIVEEAPTPVQETVEITDGDEGSADPAPSADPFMGSSWPLVLSITCEKPQNIRIKRDNDRQFSEVNWPGAGEEASAVPEAGFEAGRAYSHYDNLVVFWGAEDHFSIILERVRGVQVAINGTVHDISRVKPGQELILDAHVAGAGARR